MDDSYVVCNGEIYGFEKWKEELKEKYVFKSESDCEVLLPLYQEYGVEMFAMLDAEFACIIYDGKTREFIVQEIRLESVLYFTDMIKTMRSFLQAKRKTW